MVPKVFEPLKFDCIVLLYYHLGRFFSASSHFSSFQALALVFRFDKSLNEREISAKIISVLTTEVTFLAPFHFVSGKGN